jgi:hypothetical protein
MKKKQFLTKKKLAFVCCICEEAIRPSSEPCCTILIDRGVPGSKQRPTFNQSAYAHGACLKKHIPITKYSFPELGL